MLPTNTTLSIASYLGMAFLLLLAVLHVLKPEFDPAWRMISEYEIGKYGWLMRLAFFCWGGGFLLFVLSLWHRLGTFGGKVGKWWLLLISMALFGAGLFAPQPITDLTRGTTDKLHALCGALMIFTLPIAATLIAFALSKHQTTRKSKTPLFWFTLLVWMGLIAFFYTMVRYASQAKTRAYGPDVLIGWPNRFLVLTYSIWLIAVARISRVTNKRESGS